MSTYQFGDARLSLRFWAKARVDESGCWLWTAGLVGPDLNLRYGAYRMNGVQHRAHRVAYVALVAAIPEGLQLDHLCRVARCVNPAHLEAVTARVNVLRSNAPSAHNARATHCKNGHEFNETNTLNSRGRRICRPCKRVYERRVRSQRRLAAA